MNGGQWLKHVGTGMNSPNWDMSLTPLWGGFRSWAPMKHQVLSPVAIPFLAPRTVDLGRVGKSSPLGCESPTVAGEPWESESCDGLWWFVSRYPPVNEHSYEIHGFPVRPFFLPNSGFSRSLLVKGWYLLFAVCFLYTKPQVYSATIWVYPKRCGRCQLCLGSVRCFFGWGPREYLAGEVQCYLVGVRRPSDGGFWCSCLLIGVY